MRVGLTYQEAQDVPFGELLDYVAIEQIKTEGCVQVPVKKDVSRDEEIIPDVL